MTYEKIRERYLKSCIRDDQLERFAALGVITAEQLKALQTEKINALANESGGGR